jgi:hypothetical protein
LISSTNRIIPTTTVVPFGRAIALCCIPIYAKQVFADPDQTQRIAKVTITDYIFSDEIDEYQHKGDPKRLVTVSG